MASSQFTIIRTNSSDKNFINLVALLDEDLAIRDGDEHAFYAPHNVVDNIKEVVVAYKNHEAIGCGAIKLFSQTGMEVKRVFVKQIFRQQGVAARIIKELEKWAGELGFTECVLETGKQQPEAIALYKKFGYRFTPNYWPYIGVDNSICMSKKLKP